MVEHAEKIVHVIVRVEVKFQLIINIINASTLIMLNNL